MSKSWKTTIGGLITALGAGLINQNDEKLRMLGQACSILGPIILGWAAKDKLVTGGTIPQANAPGVVEKSDALGVIAAVDAIKTPTYEETKIKEMAQQILAAPPIAPEEIVLKTKGGC